MKRKIQTIFVMICVLGIVSAGVVAYVSNTIQGTINVEGPVFYLDNDQSLVLNDEPKLEDTIFNISESEVFFVYDTQINNLYASTFLISIAQSADNNNNQLNFSIIKKHGDNYEVICSGLTKDSTSVYRERVVECSSEGEINFNEGEKLSLLVSNYSKNIGSSYIRISEFNSNEDYPRIEITKTQNGS